MLVGGAVAGECMIVVAVVGGGCIDIVVVGRGVLIACGFLSSSVSGLDPIVFGSLPVCFFVVVPVLFRLRLCLVGNDE
jgi:hypothetical protein